MTQLTRCAWVAPGNELYERYHDDEWGVPVNDDHILFEFLVLESAQAGLSWLTVLRKREAYRQAFAGFDPAVVATFDETKLEQLMQNAGLIRNRPKLAAAINNARRFLEIQREFGSFSCYQWQFVGGQPQQNRWQTVGEVPALTPTAQTFSDDLRRRGFKFVGPTTIYARMQAIGMVNDHTTGCFRYDAIRRLGQKFQA